MFCIKCGAQLQEDTTVCESCGADMNEELKSVQLTDEINVVDAEPVTENECLHSFNNMDYEEDIVAKKQLKQKLSRKRNVQHQNSFLHKIVKC